MHQPRPQLQGGRGRLPDPDASSTVEGFHPLRATAFFIWRKIMSDAVCRCKQGIFGRKKRKITYMCHPKVKNWAWYVCQLCHLRVWSIKLCLINCKCVNLNASHEVHFNYPPVHKIAKSGLSQGIYHIIGYKLSDQKHQTWSSWRNQQKFFSRQADTFHYQVAINVADWCLKTLQGLRKNGGFSRRMLRRIWGNFEDGF